MFDSFSKWKEGHVVTPETVEDGIDCIQRPCGASWWNQEFVLKQVKPYFSQTVAKWQRAQQDPGCEV
jgi:hypothetical protein